MTVSRPYSQEDLFKKRIYNKAEGTFLNRTPESWARIGTFYLIFYGALAALVATCMWVFFQTLDPRIPKWQLDRSAIGTSPGLGFRPMPKDNQESTLIWFQRSNDTINNIKWYNNILQFLDHYYTPSKIAKGNKVIGCSHTKYPGIEEVCNVEVRDWGECNKIEYFNYHKNSPCIFLKLNKIFGWTPDYYDNPDDLPDDMPDKLKQHIRSIQLNNTRERQNVWISCEGENPADVEYLGPITYYPKAVQGFPGYYFPYLNKEGYLSPLVAVKFERPVSGIVINVECRAWAKNIYYNRAERAGSVHFELLID